MQIKCKYIISSIFLIRDTFLYFCNILLRQIYIQNVYEYKNDDSNFKLW